MGKRGIGDGGAAGIFDGEERLKALSAAGDPLERLVAVIDFEMFRGDLEAALSRSDRSKGGRPPYAPVLMFKVLVLQTLYTLSDDQTAYQLKYRLSFMRFAGLALHDAVPDAKTIWLYREQLARAVAAEKLFARFDALLCVEHVFAAQKCRLGLVVRTVGMSRARVKIGLANLAYNFTRLAWLEA